MAQFIDYGSPTSDNGPPSSIGSYEANSFIDDDSDCEILEVRTRDASLASQERRYTSPLFIPSQSMQGGIQSVASNDSRASSVYSGPVVRQESGRHGMGARQTSRSTLYGDRSGRTPQGGRRDGVRTPRRNSRENTFSSASTPLIRRGGPRGQVQRLPRMQSRDIRSVSSRVRDRSSSEMSVRPSVELPILRRRSGSRFSTPGTPQFISDSAEPDAVDLQRVSAPDPFRIPTHLRAEELGGITLPGKRLANGNPRWASRYYMVTYSQSGPDWPYEDFIDLCNKADVKYHISRELHRNGGYHFHCFIDYGKGRKGDFEDIHKFCVGNPEGNPCETCPGQVHGNVLCVPRTPFNTYDYVTKWGTAVASNCERPQPKGPNVTRDDLWKSSLAFDNKKEFYDDVKRHSPRDLVLFNRQIETYGNKTWGYDKNPPKMPKIEEDGIFVHWERYPAARKWVLDSLSDPIERIKSLSRGVSYPMVTEEEDKAYIEARSAKKRRRPKSLIVWGPSRLGKTLFATNLGAHVHWQRDFNLNKLIKIGTENVEYAVFDDISWKNASLKEEGFKAWLGGNDEFDVSDKFLHKHELKWGKPCVVVTNKDPYIGLDPEDAEWFDRNCITIMLGNWNDLRSEAICSSDAHSED